MTAYELTAYLNSNGINAIVEDNAAIILLENMPTEKEERRFRKMIKDTGYNASWGIYKIQTKGGVKDDSH